VLHVVDTNTQLTLSHYASLIDRCYYQSGPDWYRIYYQSGLEQP